MPQATTPDSPVMREILTELYSLGSVDDAIRCTTLFSLTRVAQKAVQSERQYLAKRLIRGLASFSGACRQGFAAAIVLLLKSGIFHATQLLNQIDQDLSDLVGDDTNNALIARALFLNCVAPYLEGAESIDAFATILQSLRSKKKKSIWMDSLCAESLIKANERVDKAAFKQHFLPLLKAELEQPLLDCSPVTIFLLLSLQSSGRKLKKICSWLQGTAVSEDEVRKIAHSIIVFVRTSRNEHVTFPLIAIDWAVQKLQPELLTILWNKVLLDEFLPSDELTQHMFCVDALCEGIRLASSDAQLEIVLSGDFCKRFAATVSPKHNNGLYQYARPKFEKLSEDFRMRSEKPEEHSVFATTVLNVLQRNYPEFGSESKLNFVDKLLQTLDDDDAKLYLDSFLTRLSTVESQLTLPENLQTHFATLKTLYGKFTENRIRGPIVRFLACLATGVKRAELTDTLTFKPSGALRGSGRFEFRKAAKNCLFDLHATHFHCKPSVSGKLFYVNAENPASFHSNLFAVAGEKVEGAPIFKDAVKLLRKIDYRVESNRAFSVLLSLSLLVGLLEDRARASDWLSDLSQCYRNHAAAGGSSDDADKWLHVLVDLMLEMTSLPQRQARETVGAAIHYLSGCIDDISYVEPLLSAVDTRQDPFEVADASDGEEGEDEDDGGMESSSDEEGECEIVELPNVNDELRNKIEETLREYDQSGEESEIDIDTVEEGKLQELDDALARLFSNSQQKRKSADEAMSFRMRVIDLLQVYVSADRESHTKVVVALLPVLIRLIADCSVDASKEARQVIEKLKKLVERIASLPFTLKSEENVLTQADLIDTTEALLSLTDYEPKIPTILFSQLGKALSAIYRICSHFADEKVKKKCKRAFTQALDAKLQECISDSAKVFNSDIFATCFRADVNGFLHCLPVLIEQLLNRNPLEIKPNRKHHIMPLILCFTQQARIVNATLDDDEVLRKRMIEVLDKLKTTTMYCCDLESKEDKGHHTIFVYCLYLYEQVLNLNTEHIKQALSADILQALEPFTNAEQFKSTEYYSQVAKLLTRQRNGKKPSAFVKSICSRIEGKLQDGVGKKRKSQDGENGLDTDAKCNGKEKLLKAQSAKPVVNGDLEHDEAPTKKKRKKNKI